MRTRRSIRPAMRGMTLLEVLLVIALLLVLFSFVLPAFTGTMRARGLPESCERLRSLLQMTRTAAMRDGVRYRFEFPGAPDPDDPLAERMVETPVETQQPIIKREKDPLNEPGVFEDVDMELDGGKILLEGVRCVSVRLGFPSFDVNDQAAFAGPEVNGEESPLDVMTFNPDGTCDWATFALTTVGADDEVVESDIERIVNVIVDGRTGQTWFQRPMRNTEVELMNRYGASPCLHADFLDPAEITEDNILDIGHGVLAGRGAIPSR